jgi:hypothetical protein
MAKQELYEYKETVGYDGMSGYNQELYDLYRQLDGYESHSCFSGVGFPTITLVFMVGCLCGRFIKRFM